MANITCNDKSNDKKTPKLLIFGNGHGSTKRKAKSNKHRDEKKSQRHRRHKATKENNSHAITATHKELEHSRVAAKLYGHRAPHFGVLRLARLPRAGISSSRCALEITYLALSTPAISYPVFFFLPRSLLTFFITLCLSSFNPQSRHHPRRERASGSATLAALPSPFPSAS